MRRAPVMGRGAPASEAPPDAALCRSAFDELSGAVAKAAEVVRARPAGLVADFDGTLSPIVATPEEAFLLPEARAALRRLARRLELVAVVSGRRADEVRRLVGLRRLVYLGNHGLERWEGGRQTGRAAVRPWRAALTAAMADLRRGLAGLPGLRIEDKGVSFSVHYRGAPNHGAARAAALAAAWRVAAPCGLSVREAKKVVEVGPPSWPGKAAALAELASQFQLRSLVCLGDDLPDLEAFRRLADLGGRGVATLAIAVDGPEAPSELKEAADLVLGGPEQVARFLTALDTALAAAGRGRFARGMS